MKTDIIFSLIAGAIGGALVIMLTLNSPSTAKFFQSNKPLIPNTLPNSSPVTKPDQNNEPLLDYQTSVVRAVEKANQAVVSIVVTKDVPIIEQYYDDTPDNLFNPFDGFFGNNDFFSPFNFRVPQYRQKGTEKREVGGGSGFIVSTDGLIITNRHVVEQDDSDYTVFTNDGTKYNAKVLAKDSVNDLAVLQIDGHNLPFLQFNDANNLKVGQTVIAIGNALGEFRNTVSVGVVSGLSRSITAANGLGRAEQIDEVIQTDAAINPGNSGGPLLNLDGQVIGINVAVALGSENIGFALPANIAHDVIKSVRKTGRIVRPYLGVRYTMVTPILKKNNNLTVDHGALIIRGDTPEKLAIMPGSPADKAGLKEGDIILAINGQEIDNHLILSNIIQKYNVGDTITLKILSKGQNKEIAVILEETPP